MLNNQCQSLILADREVNEAFFGFSFEMLSLESTRNVTAAAELRARRASGSTYGLSNQHDTLSLVHQPKSMMRSEGDGCKSV
jgi:hypothetical protein